MIVCYVHCLFHCFNQWSILLTKLAMSVGITLLEIVQLLSFIIDIHRIIFVSLKLSPVPATLSLIFVLGEQSSYKLMDSGVISKNTQNFSKCRFYSTAHAQDFFQKNLKLKLVSDSGVIFKKYSKFF